MSIIETLETSTATQQDAASVASPLSDLLGIGDLSSDQAASLLSLALKIKQQTKADPASWASALAHKHAVMLFEKPSLRTRVSFEIGFAKLGGSALYFDHGKQRIGQRESTEDYAKNLERMCDVIIARVFDHEVLEEMAQASSVPVINALSDAEHPCQALADMLTLTEHLSSTSGGTESDASIDSLAGKKLAWVGDGNNVCHSLMLICAKLGVDMTIVTPKGFEPQFSVLKQALTSAEQTGATITLARSVDAISGHHAVYTDTWISMGQDHQADLRSGAFAGLQVDADVMAIASEGLATPAKFMHCLPAHRGEEVTADVIDGPNSVVFDQAENRMWAQNALLVQLLGGAALPHASKGSL